jgi:hypothetical protein
VFALAKQLVHFEKKNQTQIPNQQTIENTIIQCTIILSKK